MAASVRGVPSKLGNVFQSLKAVSANRNYFTYTPEPAQPIKDKEPKWVSSAEEAFQDLKSGDTVFAQGAAATPIEMLKGMTEVGKKKKLKDVRVCHMHTEGPAPYCNPDCEGIFRSFSFFMGGNVRKAVAEGRGDALPIFLSEIPILFYRKIIEPTYAVIQVSPPDQHGYCSLGTSVDCVRAGMSHSKIIVGM
nr:unnamed protein product [Callosobruchus analis]